MSNALLIEDYYRHIITYLCAKLAGEDVKRPVAPNIVYTQSMDYSEHKRLIEEVIKETIAVDDVAAKFAGELFTYELTAVEGMTAQLNKLDSAVENLLATQATDKTYTQMLTTIVDDGMRFVGVETTTGKLQKWRVDNWLRVKLQHIETMMNDEISHTANRQIGNSVGRFSFHAGASDLCAPDQGKIVDFDNKLEGIIEGVRVYKANSTGYATAIGICKRPTCYHNWYPWILGINTEKDFKAILKTEKGREVKAAAENKRAIIEGKIRDAKTKAHYYEQLGSEKRAQNAKNRVSFLQGQQRQHCAKYGITRRYERERAYRP